MEGAPSKASVMKSLPDNQPVMWPWLAWSFVAVTGIVAPVAALLLLSDALGPEPPAAIIGSVLAVSLMGAGIIAAAKSVPTLSPMMSAKRISTSDGGMI